MKFNFFNFFLLSCFVFLLSSCLDTAVDEIVISSDASFVSLTFATNDSIPNLNKAVFSLVGDTIVNLDSLPFNTRIDSVFPTFTFTTTSAAFFHNQNTSENDSIQVTGKDTVDFNIKYKLRNFASDQKTFKDYFVKVNVHKVEPELYVWSKIKSNLSSLNVVSQKAIVFNDSVLYYINDGAANYLYTSTNGSIWGEPSAITDLPNNVSLSDMTLFKGNLYLTQNSEVIYTSTNGTAWTTKSISDYNFKSLLFALNDKLWAVTQSKSDISKYYFASSADGTTWNVETSEVISAKYPGFPTTDFTSLAFLARTGKEKALVIGGKNANDKMGSWSTENGTYWVNLSNENNSLDNLATGSSVISYDNRLFLFGNKIDELNHFKQSIDEGLTWQIPDSNYNFLPKTYQSRSYQSVVVYKPIADNKSYEANRIFILGGKGEEITFTDVWTGKLNRKSFLR